MADIALVAELRKETGEGIARKLRRAGRIPGVVYGKGKSSLPVSLSPRELELLLQSSEAGLNTLIDLRIDGAAERGASVALIKELQRDPVRGSFLHADLYEVDLTQTIEVEIPIHLTGRPRGVEMGGILDHLLRELEIECLPRAIPQSVEIDVAHLEIGDGIYVRDLVLPEGVTLHTDPGMPVAHVVPPTVEAEAAPEAEEVLVEGAEPAAEAEKPAEAPAKEGNE